MRGTAWSRVGGALAFGAIVCGALLVFPRGEALRPEAPARTEAGSGPSEGPDPSSDAIDGPSEGPDPSSDAIDLELVTEEGEALGAALVLVFRGEELVVEAVADQRGRLRLGERARGAEAAIVPPGWGAHRAALPADGGPFHLVLPTGSVVAGQALVEGRAPAAPIVLGLEPVPERPPPPFRELPVPVLQALERRELFSGKIARATGAEGRFRFGGLPADWSGTLVPPEELWIEGQEGADNPRLHLERPETQVVLRLRRHPWLTGRVVTKGERRPVPGAHVSCFLDGEHQMIEHGERADQEGRFRLLLSAAGLRSLTLQLSDAERGNQKSLRVEERLLGGGDLGDVELGPFQSVPFVVRDLMGRPIAGAVAVAGRASPPTGADGCGVLELPALAEAMEVGALGYGVDRVPIPVVVVDPIPIVLRPDTLLVIRVRGPAGETPNGLEVEVRAEERLFRAGSRPHRAHTAAAGPVDSVGFSNKVQRYRVAGDLRLAGLVPGSPLALRLLDRTQASLGREVVTLGEGETRVVEFRVEREPRTFQGIVLDPTGRPVAGAEVHLRMNRTTTTGTETKVDGSFLFSALYAETVHLEIAKPDFAVIVDPAHRLPPEGPPAVFRLETGRSVLVSVVDRAGRPFDGWTRVSAGLAGRQEPIAHAGVRGPGLHELATLPAGIVLVRVETAAQTYEVSHDTAVGSVRVLVADHGALRVQWQLSSGKGPVRVVLHPEGGRGARLDHYLGKENDPAGEALIAHVLPGDYRAELLVPDKGELVPAGEHERVTVLAHAVAHLAFQR